MAWASPAALLEGRLAAWRRTGSPEDAAAFVAEARRTLAAWPPPVPGSAREFQRAWLHAVQDTIGRCWAIDVLVEQMPGADPVQRAAALAKRIEALARYGPDPRFVHAIALVGRSEHALPTKRLTGALRRLEAAASVDPNQLIPVVRAFPEATPEVRALWWQVEADPDDDGALAVLADALQVAGDPRGELIALQLLGDAADEPARAARRKALIASCGAAWLGRLAEVIAAASFERGVLRRLQLAGVQPSFHLGWDTLITDPALDTVTDLVPGDVDPRIYVRFVASAAMRSLTHIELHAPSDPLAEIPAVPPSVTHIACPSIAIADVTRALAARGALRSIAIPESAFDALTAARWFSQLAAVTLGVGGGVRRGLALWPSLPRSMTLTLVPSPNLPPCTTAFPWDFEIALARDGDATIARVSGEWLLLPVDVLSALPANTARVEVDHASTTMVERIRSAIGRRGLDVVHRPIPRVAAVFVPPSAIARI